MSKAPATKEKPAAAFDLDMPVAGQAVATRTEAAAPREPLPTNFSTGPIDWGGVLMAMMEKSSDPNLDKDKFVVMKDAVREFRDDARKQAFATAMSGAQSECQAVVRASEVKLIKKDGDKVEDKGSYKFASESEIDAMIRPIMTKYGFSVTHNRERAEGGLLVKSTLWHTGGHTITAEFPLALDSGAGKNNLQAGGSTDSYGRKYNLLGFFNIVRKGEDNDGASTGGKGLTKEQAYDIRTLISDADVVPRDFLSNNLNYPVTKFPEIHQEDFIRLKRLLMSIKAANEAKEQEGLKV